MPLPDIAAFAALRRHAMPLSYFAATSATDYITVIFSLRQH